MHVVDILSCGGMLDQWAKGEGCISTTNFVVAGGSPHLIFSTALTSTVFEVLQCFTNGIHCEKPQFNRGELTTYDWWHIYPHLARTSRFHRQISTKPSPNAAVSTGFTLR